MTPPARDPSGANAPTAHVVFPLDVEDGWPPVSAERLWAYDLGANRYEINNAPWFVRDLAAGDVVEAIADDPAQHPTFIRLLERSPNLTIRLICLRQGPLRGNLQAVIDAFTPFGVWAEGAEQYGMVALDIPPNAALEQIYRRLLAGQADGSWDWDEGRINNAWNQAADRATQT